MLLSLSFLSLLSVAFASQHIPRHPHPKRASDANTGPDKFSLYDAGLWVHPCLETRPTHRYFSSGACGGTNTDSEFVVALNIPQWDNGANCYKEITITYNGKTTNAQIVDQCQICPDGGLDLSRGLFTFFEDPSVGIIHGMHQVRHLN
ncbi:RlpA-like double-psi beta-barrel-protein domain-containing protein-containing protein [Mycena galericulata]|nr:RlpA-like double-psi beta-barrel-protein domain-containing protein-containing protein [Mycena galericulata]